MFIARQFKEDLNGKTKSWRSAWRQIFLEIAKKAIVLKNLSQKVIHGLAK